MAKQTATEVTAERRTQALALIAEIQAKLEAPVEGAINWGHAGDAAEVLNSLRRAAHWAGIAGHADI